MKNTITSIIIVLVLISGIFIFAKGSPKTENKNQNIASANNVTVENRVQIVEIKARGGYSPRTSIAKAGIPTILRFSTSGTFDCSSSVRIPSLNISKNLPFSGVMDIELPSPSVGTLHGTCDMGMYPFKIVFQN